MKDSTPFFERLAASCRAKQSLLCVGLDPRPSVKEGESALEKILALNGPLIEQTAAVAAAYKPNIAFYEAWGAEGHEALRQTLALIPPGTPVILDAKRGDIGPTAEAYAKAAFEDWKVDSVTLAPYMGSDSVEPFLRYPDKGVFVLARTSNPGAKVIQDWKSQGERIYLKVAKLAAGWGAQVGLVAAGNDEKALAKLRHALPETWFLAPGIGAQGGTMTGAFQAGARKDGLGLLAVAAREIAQAPDPALKAQELRDQLNHARENTTLYKGWSPKDRDAKLKKALLRGLITTGCFKLGEFTLKSGLKSPFYVDLRRLGSDPAVLAKAGKAYARLMKDMSYDRVAGIPVAALPLATAAALEARVPLIYPRIPPKAHGSGNVIEGEYKAGERVVLLDDLITTGASKVEALEVLRGEGLVVQDLVVLLERGTQGRRDMEAAGVRVHSFLTLEELLDECRAMKLVDDEMEARIQDFFKNS